MTKKISDVSIGRIAFGNRQIEGFSSGIWETNEVIVGDNEINNFCSIFLFSLDKDAHFSASSGCSLLEYQLCFVFPGQRHHWKFEKSTSVHYFIIKKSIIDNIPFLSSPSINFLKQFPAIKLTTYEFDIVQYEFNNIYEEMNRLDMLEGIIYSRIATIFAETYRFIENRYVNNTNT